MLCAVLQVATVLCLTPCHVCVCARPSCVRVCVCVHQMANEPVFPTPSAGTIRFMLKAIYVYIDSVLPQIVGGRVQAPSKEEMLQATDKLKQAIAFFNTAVDSSVSDTTLFLSQPSCSLPHAATNQSNLT